VVQSGQVLRREGGLIIENLSNACRYFATPIREFGRHISIEELIEGTSNNDDFFVGSITGAARR
jgi:hypothetical protein